MPPEEIRRRMRRAPGEMPPGLTLHEATKDLAGRLSRNTVEALWREFVRRGGLVRGGERRTGARGPPSRWYAIDLPGLALMYAEDAVESRYGVAHEVKKAFERGTYTPVLDPAGAPFAFLIPGRHGSLTDSDAKVRRALEILFDWARRQGGPQSLFVFAPAVWLRSKQLLETRAAFGRRARGD